MISQSDQIEQLALLLVEQPKNEESSLALHLLVCNAALLEFAIVQKDQAHHGQTQWREIAGDGSHAALG
jgi:hypothetical protein